MSSLLTEQTAAAASPRPAADGARRHPAAPRVLPHRDSTGVRVAEPPPPAATRFLPPLVHDAARAGRSNGELEATALYLDLSGFTQMTAALAGHGNQGAAVLSELLNRALAVPVEAVRRRGGFVAYFAGDALAALFPAGHEAAALAAAFDIDRGLRSYARSSTPLGDFSIQAKVGLAHGQVNWRIVDERVADRVVSSYVFAGEALERAIVAEQHAESGDIVADASLSGRVADELVIGSVLHDRLTLVSRLNQPPPLPPVAPAPAPEQADVLARFLPDAVRSGKARPSFRRAAIAFVVLAEAADGMDARMGRVVHETARFGGYLSGVEAGDKGCVALVVFGAPLSREDDVRRAVDFAASVRGALGAAASVAVTVGTVFAGYLGSESRSAYTVLGVAVNLAARLATVAPAGQAWLSAEVAAAAAERYETEAESAQALKGFEEPVAVYRLAAGRSVSAAAGNYRGALVERGRELADLTGALQPLTDRQFAGVTYVYGDAGIGKGRLVDAAVHAAGASVLRLRPDGILRKSLNPFVALLSDRLRQSAAASESDNRAALHDQLTALRERLRSAAAATRQPPLVQRALAELDAGAPFLANLLGLGDPVATASTPEARFQGTALGLKAYLQSCSLVDPVVVWVQSAHLLDTDSRAVLEMLVRDAAAYPLAFVISARPADDGTSFELQLPGAVVARTIRLQPLSRMGSAELAASRCGGTVSEPLLEYLHEQSGGNPFYVEQLCGYLRDHDLLEPTPGGLAAHGTFGQVPADVNALLVARIDRMPPPIRAAVQVACVLGRSFDAALATSLLSDHGGARRGARQALERGVEAGIWEEVTPGTLTFLSDLLRTAAYDMQLVDDVRATHRRAALVLEDLRAADAGSSADIAYHYDRAGLSAKAVEYYGRAARFAQENFKNDKALELYARQFELAATELTRLEALAGSAAVLELTGEWEPAEVSLSESVAIAAQSGLLHAEARVRSQLGDMLRKKGEYEPAQRQLRRALQLARETGDEPLQGDVLLNLGITAAFSGRYDQALARYAAARAIRTQLGDQAGVGLVAYYQGAAHRDAGDLVSAQRLLLESDRTLRAHDDKYHLTFPIYGLGNLYEYQGKSGRAERCFEEARALYEQIGYRSGVAATLVSLGRLAMRRGTWRRSLRLLRDSMRIARELGEPLAIAFAGYSIGVYHFERGQFGRAHRQFTSALALLRRIKAQGYFGYVYSYLTLLYAATGRFELALRVATAHYEQIAKTGSDVEHGRTALGVALALSAAAAAGDGAAASALQRLTTATGHEARPEVFFELAIATAKRAPYVPTLVPALREAARFYLSRPDQRSRQRGEVLCRRALQLAAGADMRLERERLGGLSITGHRLSLETAPGLHKA